MTKQKEQDNRKLDTRKNLLKRLIQVIMQIVLFAVLLFVSVGRLVWYWAWIYLGTYIVIITINAFILPNDLIEERGKSKENVKKWDRVIMTFNIFPALGLLVVAGLDYRFGWAPKLNSWIQVVALVLMVLGNAFFTWAMLSNHFFSTAVRIQFDRSYQVATGGPYNYMRHPWVRRVYCH
jgi:protein-S-isoprenylcysteine O-methyltransferase Ste14